jgi:leucyl-tRNA synthetase
MDFLSIEKKWRRKWEENKVFEANPDPNKKKYFITVAYPYPNSPQHIGHGRTYTLADVHARYLRMKGYNVLLPMAFHYTGTPILAMVRRIAEGDEDLIDTFKRIYHVPDEVIKKFTEPLKIARYFHEEIKEGMKEMGYSIDWRREFTTIDEDYSNFISWQFRKLYEKGLVTKGTHPVGWCPKDGNPVGQHDTLGDVEPEIGEFTLIKFEFKDAYILTATLRPETIFGVTNIWINPNADYVKAKVDGEVWLVSKDAAKRLEFQNKKVKIIDEFKGRELIKEKVKNPMTSKEHPILPASFVNPKSGSGIVMSVPAHAPYDYQAIEDLKRNDELLKEFGISEEVIKELKPIVIISSQGYEGIPALVAIKKHNVKDQRDPALEKATSELYSHEFHKGVMLENTAEYAGMSVSEAREVVKHDLMLIGKADTIYELLNAPVICRCGTECIVKTLKDQWFLNYGDTNWKGLARDCLRHMEIVPEDVRAEFEYTIDWLKERACARQSGLGTKLPWDENWIIESLSDSVIYMAFYLIKRIIDKYDVKASKLTDEVFDYVLLGKGNAEEISKKEKISLNALKEMRREFTYFYPLDSRHSGRDLIPNHLTFFIFNHAAIFSKEHWPKQIVVNGSVLMEGKKMSKSFGNILPLRDAIKKYGADSLRLAILSTAELMQDADFSISLVKSYAEKIEKFYILAEKVAKEYREEFENAKLTNLDKWLLSTLHNTIKKVTEAMDRLRVREAVLNTTNMLDLHLSWYWRRLPKNMNEERKKGVYKVLKEYVDVKVRLLSPFAPFISEEIWERIGGKGFASIAPWPKADESKIDLKVEAGEELIKETLEDIKEIIKVTKMTPKKAYIYTASDWKWKAYLEICEIKDRLEFGRIMRSLMSKEEFRQRGKEVSDYIQQVINSLASKELREIKRKVGRLNELEVLNGAKEFLERELEFEVIVFSEDDEKKYDPVNRSSKARPYKPAIYLE